MGALTGSDIQEGDIFLCKSFSVRMNATHAGIRFGQFMFDDLIRSNTVHAALAVSNGTEPAQVIESTGQGVHEGLCDVEADVCRLRRKYADRERLAAGAAQVARDLKAWTADRKTSGGAAAGHYNLGRSMFSVLRLGYYGSQGKQVVEDVNAALNDQKNYENGFFCSMLVVLCYQVAALRLKLPAPPIERDAMNMNPAALQRYLRGHKDVWACVGIYNRPAGDNAFSRWAQRLTKDE